jgi:hypothetical protein
MSGAPAAAPFEPGNDAALSHGAYSARRLQPLADELAAELVQVAPWCSQRAFAAAVASWAYAEAQLVVLREWLGERGMLDPDGVPWPAAAMLERVEARAARARSELGLSPSSWARLIARLGSADGASVAQGVAALQEAGRDIDAQLRALPEGEEDGEHATE